MPTESASDVAKKLASGGRVLGPTRKRLTRRKDICGGGGEIRANMTLHFDL